MLHKVISGLKRTFHTPLTSIVIILAMSFSLFLLVAFSLIWNSKDSICDRWSKSANIFLYLKKNVSPKIAVSLTEKLRQNPFVEKTVLTQPNEGMKAFAESTAFNTLLSSFKENPLPSVITIYPKIKLLSKNVMLGFIQELKNQHEVEVVKADTDWLEQSYNWLNLWDNLSLILILLLSINVFIVTCGISYISVKIFNHVSKEILPYQIAWYGLISSMLAILSIKLISIALQNQNIFVQELDPSFVIFMIFGSVFFSFTSSKIAFL